MYYHLRVTVALPFFSSGKDSIPVAFGGRVALENLSPRFKLLKALFSCQHKAEFSEVKCTPRASIMLIPSSVNLLLTVYHPVSIV